MSRRYGRKQRRAAREQIDGLCTLLSETRQVLVRTIHDVDKAEINTQLLLESIRLWDSEIRSLLGPYTSFAIDDTTYRVDHPDQIRQMPVMPPLSLLPLGPSDPSMCETLTYHVETMLGFMCRLEEHDLERLRRYLTVRVMIGSDYPQGQAYYAVSEQTWHQMKRDGPNSTGLERFIHRIAGDLMRLLVTPPKKKKSDGDDLVDSMVLAMQRHGL